MKKIIIACFAALLLVFGGVSSAQADEYLRVGMEAAVSYTHLDVYKRQSLSQSSLVL